MTYEEEVIIDEKIKKAVYEVLLNVIKSIEIPKRIGENVTKSNL